MLIVDAYNALQTSGVLPPHLAGIELEGLARLVSQSRYASRTAILVCDGKPHSASLARAQADRHGPDRRQLHGCDVLFAGAGNDADSLIERLISQSSAPGRLTVVSTDRRLRRAAARRGALSISSAEFLRQLATDAARPPKEAYPAFAQEIPLDPYSLTLWMREFGIDDQAGVSAPLSEGAARSVPANSKRPPASPVQPPAAPRGADKVSGAGRAASAGKAPSAGKSPTLPANPDPLLGDPHLSDPLLLEALRHWGHRMTPDELDMRRWLARETRKGRDAAD